jgi:hypothetical protein
VITIQVERWRDVLPEMWPLFPLHWEEMALDKDVIKIDMDVERYAKLDELDMIHVTTVRDDKTLVGYVICFIIRHMHYANAGEMALADMYWLSPDYRRGLTGMKMFKVMEESLRERGIIRAHMSCKVSQDHTKLFERMGWRLSDLTFSKMLKRGS